MKKKSPILLTGVAGFIGFHTALKLLEQGTSLIGVDSLSSYYDVSLKESRLKVLQESFPNTFQFFKASIEDRTEMERIWKSSLEPIRQVIHLAAQAGVRYSLENPYEYITTNITGHLVLLELARHYGALENFVYATSSSVYGGNKKLPFSESDRTDSPLALYAATKKCDELMTEAYAHLFRIPAIGLRFFTAYGPWGRPDQALFIFTKKILAGETISVFNNGHMKRDFTYIDDIVAGILGALNNPIKDTGQGAPHKIYNLGNSSIELLMDYIHLIEENLGKKAKIEYLPMQPGDVPAALSDITEARRDLGFDPKTSIKEGVKHFIEWYRGYYSEEI
jgi:UDP-glucuronate 4-epimerase